MLQKLSEFRKCESGNMAMMMGAGMLLLAVAGGGAVELSDQVRIKGNLQVAADEAVLATLSAKPKTWRDAQQTAHDMFDLNLHNKNRFSSIKRRVRKKIRDNKLTLTYKVKVKIKPLMGELNPFASDEMTITSSAQVGKGSPYLLPKNFKDSNTKSF